MSGNDGFDVEAFLARPLTARLATSGPTVRPVWYLWEDSAFWIITGRWWRVHAHVKADPRIALVVDECDLATGIVRQVIVRGRGELVPFDLPRGRRKLRRYLGVDESRWDPRFRLADGVADSSQTKNAWLRIGVESLVAKDLSFSV
ncbi:pyridoxamine 5'-phosphate oxidase family protein [Asanoa siamensis]|uniref:Pyridoxamine 5'-phosphate oxidase N-terminal domain-containing protein n=1 Tax=Asanoa siamensis TaxID=926357 RepID=A0ABQ4CWV7_9ACTN|nr:pyridoxamine 5'-phosphate oxidase family protein [Asanoa siamensis]GIF75745.1 hypothetical protein Asi02nite_52630 [Asanoa siamensis]